MNTILRAGRAYWRLNEIAWHQIKRAKVPLLMAFGAASVAAWVVGVQTGELVLMWMPAAYAWTWLLAHVIAR